MIQGTINILLIEDNEADVVLIKRQISKVISLPKIIHVATFERIVESIDLFKPDIIISDYQLHEFTGLDVLEYLKSSKIHIPFIFITGTINDEELAANTILTGAMGYILKKNINQLHKKLAKYFSKVIQDKKTLDISEEQKKFFSEMKEYIETVNIESKVMRAEYLEMKKALERIKSLNK